MKKEDWEKLHGFRKSEHTCSFCKHSNLIQKTPWDTSYYCREKRKVKAGSATKASYECDLWEHR
jgi:hypothetical protein